MLSMLLKEEEEDGNISSVLFSLSLLWRLNLLLFVSLGLLLIGWWCVDALEEGLFSVVCERDDFFNNLSSFTPFIKISNGLLLWRVF